MRGEVDGTFDDQDEESGGDESRSRAELAREMGRTTWVGG